MKRNPKKLWEAVYRKDPIVVAKKPLRLVFPTRWLERELAVIESTIEVLGYVALVDEDDNYAVMKVPGKIRTEPDRISNMKHEDEDFTVFYYNPGSKVIASTDIVVVDSLVHPIFTELLGRGRIPFYYDYDKDYAKLFSDIGYYNGVDKSGDPAIWSYYAATTARDPSNPQDYYRHAKAMTQPPIQIGLKKVALHSRNVLGKQGGSYFEPGTTSALSNPSRRVDPGEVVLTQT